MIDALSKADLNSTDVVLDVGCNAGVFGIHLSEYVKKTKNHSIRESKYYKTLFRYYENKNFLERIQGHREITRKFFRILKINEWLMQNRDFHGLHSFLLGQKFKVCNLDFPILVEVKNKEEKLFDVQLDGSHKGALPFITK